LALTFDEFGMWLHLGGSYWQRVSVDAVIIVAALLGLVAYAPALERFESHHRKAFVILALVVAGFGIVIYTTGVRVGHVVGPELHALELSSSP
jgi:Kef-type K+ transport system membrane component KefB